MYRPTVLLNPIESLIYLNKCEVHNLKELWNYHRSEGEWLDDNWYNGGTCTTLQVKGSKKGFTLPTKYITATLGNTISQVTKICNSSEQPNLPYYIFSCRLSHILLTLSLHCSHFRNTHAELWVCHLMQLILHLSWSNSDFLIAESSLMVMLAFYLLLHLRP